MNITRNNNKLYYLVCIALLIVAAGSRFHELSENSLWLDEAATANCFERQLILAGHQMQPRTLLTCPLSIGLVGRSESGKLAI